VGLADPACRTTDLWALLFASLLLRRFSTALRIAFLPFIQVSLIQGLKIDTLAYIYLPASPFEKKAFDPKSLRAKNPNPYFHQDQS
jgi:hypothetical protein